MLVSVEEEKMERSSRGLKVPKQFKAEVMHFMAVLRSCANTKDLCRGSRAHADLLRRGLLDMGFYLADSLINMYVKCSALLRARALLHGLPVRNVVSWTALIAGYVQHGKCEEALTFLEQMRGEGISPNAVTFSCILRACASLGAACKGEKIHDEIAKQGLLGSNIVLGNALVDMYVKCGVLEKAQKVLEKLPSRDVVSWTTLIAGYALQGQGEEALDCFKRMQDEGISPNSATFVCILKAFGSLGAAEEGESIHGEIARQGLLGKDIVLGSALVDMYAKCGMLAKAQEVLKELPARDVVSWTALIAGYVQQGQSRDALDCFERMQDDGFSPNAVTFACILNACGSLGAADKGEQIHDEITRKGLLGNIVELGSALVDMYAKCGALAKAQEVLEELPAREVVSWTALITGYAQQGQGKEALQCFERMQEEGLSPNAVTYAGVLKACGSLGAGDKGEEIHDEISRQGLLGKDIVLGSALVDMYVKCGALAKARKTLEELPERDVVSWTALIAGYVQQGLSHDALDCFEQMQRQGLSPNAFTFSCILNTCSHSGLVDEGQMYFANMSRKYGIEPDLEHYTRMVDLFGRAGHLDKAVAIVRKMPSHDYCVVWHALLGACRKWRDVKIGRWAFEHVVQLDKNDVAAYVLMANIYAAAGMQDDAENIEAMRVKNRAWKSPGCSWWIDMNGNVHFFGVGDVAHERSQEGCLYSVSKSVADDVKKSVLCGHEEKLALACALINIPQGESVCFVDNMCISQVATSFVPKLVNRKILIKNMKCSHGFEDGKCCFGDC